MKKKIEINIFHAIIYVIAFLLVSGMLFYKSCLDPNQTGEEIVAPIEDEQAESIEPKVRKARPAKPSAQPADEPEILPEEEEILDMLQPEVVTLEDRPKTEERPRDQRIRISEERSLFNLSQAPGNNIAEGRKYFENETGLLESVIIEDNDGASEALIARNKKGEEIARLEISRINTDGQVTKYATFSQNKIRVFELISSDKKNEEEEIRTEYTVRPDFQFIKGKSYSKLR